MRRVLQCVPVRLATELLSGVNFTAEVTSCVSAKVNCGLRKWAGCEFPHYAVFCNLLSLALCVTLSVADQVSHPQNNITGSLSGEVSSCACFFHRVGKADNK